jgi:hypothetical protein
MPDKRINQSIEKKREHQCCRHHGRGQAENLIVEQQQKGGKSAVLHPIGDAAQAVGEL